jgi:septum formation protein
MAEVLILASSSKVRARLLRDAGLNFEIVGSDVDEDQIKQQHGEMDVETLARTLARAKAAAVARTHPDAFVIGADQILECEGRRFDKPKDLSGASGHLKYLRGRTHRLVTAAVVRRGNATLWENVSEPRLTMRPFSDSFLADYLKRAGNAVLSSVGAYQLEGLGVQLFEHIEGDYFSILGLPLLPLMAFLRAEGALAA